MHSLNVQVLWFVFGLMMAQWAETCRRIFNFFHIDYQYMLCHWRNKFTILIPRVGYSGPTLPQTAMWRQIYFTLFLRWGSDTAWKWTALPVFGRKFAHHPPDLSEAEGRNFLWNAGKTIHCYTVTKSPKTWPIIAMNYSELVKWVEL